MPTTRSINDLYYISDGIDSGAEAWGMTLQGALANQAHSALRRARHFQEAAAKPANGCTWGRVDRMLDYLEASRRQMWSVR